MRSVSSPRAVNMRIGVWARARILRQTSNPSISGSITSRITASKVAESSAASPSRPLKSALDDKPGRAQIVLQHGGEPRIVVNEKKPLRHVRPTTAATF